VDARSTLCMAYSVTNHLSRQYKTHTFRIPAEHTTGAEVLDTLSKALEHGRRLYAREAYSVRLGSGLHVSRQRAIRRSLRYELQRHYRNERGTAFGCLSLVRKTASRKRACATSAVMECIAALRIPSTARGYLCLPCRPQKFYAGLFAS